MSDYHPDQPPSPDDGPVWVDESELESVGHAEQPPYVEDIAYDSNLIVKSADLVDVARRVTSDEQVSQVLESAGGDS